MGTLKEDLRALSLCLQDPRCAMAEDDVFPIEPDELYEEVIARRAMPFVNKGVVLVIAPHTPVENAAWVWLLYARDGMGWREIQRKVDEICGALNLKELWFWPRSKRLERVFERVGCVHEDEPSMVYYPYEQRRKKRKTDPANASPNRDLGEAVG